MIKILLAEDQALVRDGFSALLEMEGDMIVTAVSDGCKAVAAARNERPDIAVLDVRMPNMDGIECTRALKADHPTLPVLALTTFDDQSLVQACLDAGADAYLLKDVQIEDLANAIRLLLAGETLIPGDLARAVTRGRRVTNAARPQADRLAEPSTDSLSDPLTEPLTERQEEVLSLIADGLSNREIAERLYLSEGTVKNVVSEIYARLNVRDRVQAVLKRMNR